MKIPKIRPHHYRFAQYTRQTYVGVSISKEEFSTKKTYDLSFQYGKGCVYFTAEVTK